MSHANRKVAALLAAAIVLWSVPARGDDAPTAPATPAAEVLPSENVRLSSGAGMLEIGTRHFIVPQFSRVIAPPAWDRLDAELRRLQDLEVRLTAENAHMKKATKGWQPGWKLVISSVVLGFVSGGYLVWKYSD